MTKERPKRFPKGITTLHIPFMFMSEMTVKQIWEEELPKAEQYIPVTAKRVELRITYPGHLAELIVNRHD